MTPETRDLSSRAEEATSLMKSLAHQSRLMICCQLRSGEMAVGELEDVLGIKQPNLSRELGKLRDDGLVETRRESKTVYYRLSETSRISSMIDAICHVMLDKPGAFSAGKSTASRPRTFRPNRPGGYGVFARTSRQEERSNET